MSFESTATGPNGGRKTALRRREVGMAPGASISLPRRQDAASPHWRTRGLGWLSIGLGATQLLAPRALARIIGVAHGPRERLAMRALGVRELLAGVGLLRGRNPGRWLRSRVLGDAMDLAVLTRLLTAHRTKNRDPGRLGAALVAVAGVTALDVLTSRQVNRANGHALDGGISTPIAVRSVVTVSRSPEEVYTFWRDLRNLSRYVANVESVEIVDPVRSCWTVGVAGKTLAWQAVITDDRPNELLAWRTLEAADVSHSGEVRFARAPGNRGTEIHVAVQLESRAGVAARVVAKLGRAVLEQHLTNDLRRVKQGLELGEIMKSDASIHRGPHPGRPAGKTGRGNGDAKP
jgi:uncharacterized membrane protein